MINHFLSMWGCIVCSTVWAANGQIVFTVVWAVLAVFYGSLAVSEKSK